MRNLSNCKITTFRLNSALLTALFSMRREIKRGGMYPMECSCPRGCSCLQGVQLSPGGAVVPTAPTKKYAF